MEILKLFKKSKIKTRTENEHLRYRKKTRVKDLPDDDMLMGLFLYTVTRFASIDKKKGNVNKFKEKELCKDYAYFEVYVFTYYLLDSYLCKTSSNCRNEISRAIINNGVVFYQALFKEVDVGEAFNKRVELYGEMDRNGNELKDIASVFDAIVYNTCMLKRVDLFPNTTPSLDLRFALNLKLSTPIYIQTLVTALYESVNRLIVLRYGENSALISEEEYEASELLGSFMGMRDYLIKTTEKLIEVGLECKTHRSGFRNFVNCTPIVIIQSGHFPGCEEEIEKLVDEYRLKILSAAYADLKERGLTKDRIEGSVKLELDGIMSSVTMLSELIDLDNMENNDYDLIIRIMCDGDVGSISEESREILKSIIATSVNMMAEALGFNEIFDVKKLSGVDQ